MFSLDEPVLAVDTPLLAPTFRCASDAISVKLASALGAQLFRWNGVAVAPSACVDYQINDDATRYSFQIGRHAFFADGVRVTPAHFADALDAARTVDAPVARKIGHLRKVEVETDYLIVTLNRSDHLLPQKLAHPAYAPSRHGGWDGGGPFRLIDATDEGGVLQQRAGAKPGRRLRFRVVTEPHEMLRLYDQGKIDATCAMLHDDAAYRAMQKRADSVVLSPNTLFVLFPASPLATSDPVRHWVDRMVDRTSVATSPALAPQPCPPGPTPPRPAELSHLRIAYDPFPPNRYLLERVLAPIKRAGVATTLLEDDFASPAKACDFRLTILLANRADPMDVHRMITAATALYAPGVAKRMAKVLDRFDATKSTEQRTAAAQDLRAQYNELSPVIRLAHLNQIFLRRGALERFSWASDACWERLC